MGTSASRTWPYASRDCFRVRQARRRRRARRCPRRRPRRRDRAGRATLDDRADDRVDDEIDLDVAARELFGNDRERRAGRFAHAQRQRTRLASHADDEIPARRRARVFHQALDDAGSDRSRRLESERRRVVGQRKVVVDRLGDGRDADAARGSLGRYLSRRTSCRRRRCNEVAHAECRQRWMQLSSVAFVLGRIRARGAQDRAAAEVDARRRLRSSTR